MTDILELGEGDGKVGMKVFLKRKCEQEGIKWTSSPAYYVSRGLAILERRQMTSPSNSSSIEVPDVVSDRNATEDGVEIAAIVEEAGSESLPERNANSEGQLEMSLVGDSNSLIHNSPSATGEDEGMKPEGTLNVKNLSLVLHDTRPEDFIIGGGISFERVKEHLRYACKEHGLAWTSNPKFYVRKAIEIMKGRLDVPEHEQDGGVRSSAREDDIQGKNPSFVSFLRSALWNLKGKEVLKVWKYPKSKRDSFVRKLGHQICEEQTLRRPKSWQFYYTVTRKVLRDIRTKTFAENKSRRHRSLKNKSRGWKPMSRRLRDQCFHFVKMDLISNHCTGACPTLKEVIAVWKKRVRKSNKDDRRMCGHCKTMLGVLRKLSWTKKKVSVARDVCDKLTCSIRFCSLNIGGGHGNMLAALSQIEDETDVVCFQETWHLPNENISRLVPSGWKVFSKARQCSEGHRGGGVCTAIRSSFQAKILKDREDASETDDEGDSLCVRITCGPICCTVWNVYTPSDASDKAPLMTSRITDGARDGFIVLLGDFNWNALLVDHPLARWRARRETWTTLGDNLKLNFVNKEFGATFSREGLDSLLDHAWCDSRLVCSDVKITESGFEHKYVQFCVRFPNMDESMNDVLDAFVFKKPKIRWEKLRDETALPLREQLNKRALKTFRRCQAEDADDFVSTLRNTAYTVCSTRKLKTHTHRFSKLPYWDRDLAALTRSIRTTRRKICQVSRRPTALTTKWSILSYLRSKYRHLGRELKRSLWRRKNEYFKRVKVTWWRNKKIPRYAWSWFSKGERGDRSLEDVPFSNDVMNSTWGDIVSVAPPVSENEWSRKVAEYFDGIQEEEMDEPESSVDSHDSHDSTECLECPSEFSLDLLRSCVRCLPLGKASGLDAVPNEAFKYLDDDMLRHLFGIFHDILSGGAIPASWKLSEVCLIPKNEKSELTPEAFRPISLLPCISKLLECVVFELLRDYIRNKDLKLIHCLQGGFSEGRSAIDQSWMLRMVLENQECTKTNTFVAFLDIKKAYDTVPLYALLCCLIDCSLPRWFIAYCRQWIFDHRRILRLKGNNLELSVRRGVPQGSVLAPFLFNVFIDLLLRRLDGKGCSIDSTWYGALLYADDIALVASDPIELQEMIDTCVSWSNEFGMEFSAQKSKWMFLRYGRRQTGVDVSAGISFFMDGTEFDRVSHFPYLGIEVMEQKSRCAKVDTLSRKGPVQSLLQAKEKLLHPGYGLPIWIGRMIAQGMFWSKLWYGIDLGMPFHRAKFEGSKFMNDTARAVLGTFGCTKIEDMLSFLGWHDFQTICDIRSVVYFYRLCTHTHQIVLKTLMTLLESDEWRKKSIWWRTLLKSFSNLGISIPSFDGEVDEAIRELYGNVYNFVEDSPVLKLEPHPAIANCGYNACFVFIFLRGYFNPRVRGVFPSVPCPFCGDPDGDRPSHVLDCNDERIRLVVSTLCSKLETSLDFVKDCCLGRSDWDLLSLRKMQLIGCFLRDIYRLRWKAKRNFSG